MAAIFCPVEYCTERLPGPLQNRDRNWRAGDGGSSPGIHIRWPCRLKMLHLTFGYRPQAVKMTWYQLYVKLSRCSDASCRYYTDMTFGYRPVAVSIK